MRLLTNKPVNISVSSSASASEIIRQIAGTERRYHEELNRGFGNLSEGAFKGLRRQLPVTRQKIEWEKISSYRVSLYSFDPFKSEEESGVDKVSFAVGSGYWWGERAMMFLEHARLCSCY